MAYLFWDSHPVGKTCVLEDLKNVERTNELKKGLSRIDDFPEDACFHMNRRHTKSTGLADQLGNGASCTVVSKRLKEFLEPKITSPIEYLPVTIFNHKNQVASDQYFIVNPLNVIDCIKIEESEVKWNSLDPEKIMSVRKLTFDDDKIDKNVSMFRAKHLYGSIFIHEDLANEMEDQNFTGIVFDELKDYI